MKTKKSEKLTPEQQQRYNIFCEFTQITDIAGGKPWFAAMLEQMTKSDSEFANVFGYLRGLFDMAHKNKDERVKVAIVEVLFAMSDVKRMYSKCQCKKKA